MSDIVFISYKESNAETNWKNISDRFGNRVKRLHGVKGLHLAHSVAANMVATDMFYVVDGDAEISPEFQFNYQVKDNQRDHVHVFRAKNPINDLVYGYGAVKLLPTENVKKLLDYKLKPDMTSSLPDIKYNIIHEVSNITRFNTDPFNTWRSAFRECAKLSSKVIDRQKSIETEERLDIWCTIGENKPFGKFAITGAQAGRDYGYMKSDNITELFLINDWNWMQQKYKEIYFD
jgi:hypothetical protein